MLKKSLLLSMAVIPMYLASTVSSPMAKAATLACVDGDGLDIYTSSQVETTTQYDLNGNLLSIGEIAPDKCLTLETVTDGTSSSSFWVEGVSGTHVEEASCTDGGSTGSITYTVHECLGGCLNGACLMASDPTIQDPAQLTEAIRSTVMIATAPTLTTTKIESKGMISALFDGGITVGGKTLYISPATTVKYNYQKSFEVGQKVEFKGFLNSDGSILVSKIEIKK